MSLNMLRAEPTKLSRKTEALFDGHIIVRGGIECRF
jgi:hypothetical protein